MMNSFNKTILAGIVAAAFCAPAFADETTAPAPAPVTVAAPAAPTASAPQVNAVTPAAPVAAVKKQDITSKLPADLVEELKNSGDHNKEIDDLVRLKALAQAQSDLARAELDRDKARIELKRLSEPPAASTPEVAAGAGLTPPPLQATIASTPVKADPEVAKVEDTSILDDIYVTRIYVFGDKKSATVYIKNSVTTAEIGEEVAAGVKMVAVSDKAATFQYKGKKRTVRLSTQEQAYGRSYDASSKSNQNQQGMMQPSRSQMMSPGMLPGLPMGAMAGMGGSSGMGGLSGPAMPAGMSMPTMPVPTAGGSSKSNAPPGF